MTRIHVYGHLAEQKRIRHMVHLPRNSNVVVKPGQAVKALEAVAVSEVTGEHRIVNIAKLLGVRPKRAENYMLKLKGQAVDEGENLAQLKRFLRRNRVVKSPIAGAIIRIEDGIALLEGRSLFREIHAPIPGRVAQVEPGLFVIIETVADQIELAWGWGGYAWGTLKVLGRDGDASEDTRFNIDHRGALVALSATLTEKLLQEAIDIRVKGLVAASGHSTLIPLIREAGFPVGFVQGFGDLPTSPALLALFRKYDGYEVALDAGKGIDWRGKRPEIIIPLESGERAQPLPREDPPQNFTSGQRVRILQSPYYGEIGTIRTIPDRPMYLPNGLLIPGALVQVSSGDVVYIPFLNLEFLG